MRNAYYGVLTNIVALNAFRQEITQRSDTGASSR
jgi:hypothetical protein